MPKDPRVWANLKKFPNFSGYLLLGIVFMSLTLTVFYDIPQLNLGLHLHKHADIHLRDDDDAGLTTTDDGLRLGFIRRKFALLNFRRHSAGSLLKANRRDVDEEQTALTGNNS